MSEPPPVPQVPHPRRQVPNNPPPCPPGSRPVGPNTSPRSPPEVLPRKGTGFSGSAPLLPGRPKPPPGSATSPPAIVKREIPQPPQPSPAPAPVPQAQPQAPPPPQQTAEKKTIPQLVASVAESEPQLNAMKVFLAELISALTTQLAHAKSQSDEGLKMARSLQELSFSFFSNGEMDGRSQEFAHCSTMVGSLVQAVHGIFEPKLISGLADFLGKFQALQKSLDDHMELRRSVFDARGRAEELAERLAAMQKKGKVDLVKLSETQQERDSQTARCRKLADDAIYAFENLRHEFLMQCLDQFTVLSDTYRQYFQEGTEFSDSLRPKMDTWRRQAAAIRTEMHEKASQASSEGKVVMSNGMLQLLANTEQQFIEQLRLVSQGFMGAVLKDGSLFADMSKDDVTAIFGNMPQLLEFHQSVLFKKLVASQSIAATFDEALLSSMYQCYSRYIDRFVASQEALFQCKKKSKAFSHLLKSLERDPSKPATDLATLLTAPLERLREYVTFLDGSMQQAKVSAEDSQVVLRALEVLRELDLAAEHVKSANQVRVISKVVNGWPEGDGPQPQDRRFVMQIPATTQQGQGEMFIFSDLVLIAKKSNTLIPGLGKKLQYVASFKVATTETKEVEDPVLKTALELTDAKQNVTLLVGLENADQRDVVDWKIRTLRDEFDQNKVFGVDLHVLMGSKKEKGREIPSILEETVDALLASSLELEGLFRISASTKDMDDMKQQIDSGHSVSFGSYNGHAVGGILKLWIRSLPEPLLTYDLYDEFSNALKGKSVPDGIKSISATATKLPRINRASLHRLISFLSLVDRNSSKNKMNAKNLSIVFSPQLLRSRKNASMINIAELTSSSSSFDCILFMIEHCNEIFGEYVKKTPPPTRRIQGLTLSPSAAADLLQVDSTVADEQSSSELTLSLKDIIKQGPLGKSREKLRANTSWDQRWVILKKGWLYHFRSQKDTKGGVIPLSGASVLDTTIVTPQSQQKRVFSFTIRCPAGADGQPAQEHFFAAKTQEEEAAWMQAITSCTN